MKVLIFLPWKPVITENFLINEFDILRKAKVEFRAYYIYHNREVPTHPRVSKYKEITFIHRLPRPILPKLVYIAYYQIKLFLFNPYKFTSVLLWIFLHSKRYLLRNYFRIAKYMPSIVEYKPDLIYCHYTYENTVFAYFCKIFLDKQVYFTFTHQLNIYEPIYSCIDSTFSPNYFLVKAKYAKEIYKKRYPYLSGNKILILPWGIDCEYFKRQNENRNVNKIFTVLSVSRLVEQKGTIYLLRACYRLVRKNIAFRCLIYGEGKEKAKLLQFIKQNHLENQIKIIPFLTDKAKIRTLLASADLFVLPCVIAIDGEGDIVPNVLLEAMAMELPVITTKMAGMSDVIKDGINGFLVKDKDEKDLAEKILKVSKLSIEQRKEIGRRERSTVLQYYNRERLGKKFIQYLCSHV